MYCTTPRSYIHSVWRSNSGGIYNPFDYYHCRTTVCDGVITPHITNKDLKSDSYMSQLPIVKKNLQGIEDTYNSNIKEIDKGPGMWDYVQGHGYDKAAVGIGALGFAGSVAFGGAKSNAELYSNPF